MSPETTQPVEPIEPIAELPPRRRSLAARMRQLLPWLLAVLILGWLLQRVSIAEAVEAVGDADVGRFALVTLACVSAWFLLESRALGYLFSAFNAPVSWAEARSLRGLTYLVTPLNWNLGTAAMILHLRRSKRLPALETTSSILFYALIDGLVMGSLALVGTLLLPDSPVMVSVRGFAVGFVALVLTVLLFFLLRPSGRLADRLRSPRLVHAHSQARWRDAGVLIVLRSAYFSVFIFYFWAGTAAFHVDLPLAYAAASAPVIMIAGGIPLTPSGLGTQQAAMLALYAPFGSEAQIVAYGLAFPVALALGRIPFGLLYVRDLGALRVAARDAAAGKGGDDDAVA